MNNKELYSKVIDKMNRVLPKEWSKVVLGANIENNSYEVFFYVYINNEKKAINGYDLPDIEEEDIDDLMDDIYEELNIQLEKLKEKCEECWKTVTIILDRNSIVDIEYGYDNIEDIYAFKTIWKYKYLNIEPLYNESHAIEALSHYKEENK